MNWYKKSQFLFSRPENTDYPVYMNVGHEYGVVADKGTILWALSKNGEFIAKKQRYPSERHEDIIKDTRDIIAQGRVSMDSETHQKIISVYIYIERLTYPKQIENIYKKLETELSQFGPAKIIDYSPKPVYV